MNSIMPPKYDPAGVFGVAVSLYTEIEKQFGDQVSDAYDGADEFMRQCMRVGDVFERWACEHVDFDSRIGVWPYDMESGFCKAYLKSFHWSELAIFGEHQCAVVARNMGERLLGDPPPAPVNPITVVT